MDMTPEEQQDPSEANNQAPDEQPTQASSNETGQEQLTQRADSEAEPQPAETTAPPEVEQKPLSKDEALAEMRRSLREEESQEKTGFAASMGRLGNRLFRRRPKATEAPTQEAPSSLDELVIPETEAAATPDERLEAAGPHAGEAFAEPPSSEPAAESEFSSMVKKRLTNPLATPEDLEPAVAPPPAPIEQIGEPEPEPAPEPFAESEHAVPGRSILTGLRQEEVASEDELSALRKEALEDYVTEPEVAEEEGHTSITGRLRRSWRYMRPMERRLIIGTLVIAALAIMGGAAVGVVQGLPKPEPTATPTFSPVPYPISISLPGGWIFPLGIGHVVNGVWDPKQAEWLQGTELCRLVSLPYTVQLEAVLRTLNSNDEIKLSMSNYDSRAYKVQSIDQVPAGQVAELANNPPCLLVILSNADTANRWVVTAKP